MTSRAPAAELRRQPPISLIGLRCSGKTTVGRALAAALGHDLVDLDEVLAADWLVSSGGSPASPPSPGAPAESPPAAGEILARIGIDAFRDLEERVLREVLSDSGPRPGVLATGGGCVERPANRALLSERTRCVWLRVPVQVLQARLAADSTARPPLLGEDASGELEELSLRREALYAETAEIVVEAGAGSPAEIARRLLVALSSG